MSSVQSLRDFISRRLTAAAAEIFTEFGKTIVQYEEEIDRQRRLLDLTWRPRINTDRTGVLDGGPEVPQHVCKEQEEMLSDLHLCYEERNSSQDQNQPEPPQFDEEQEELFSHEEEELVLNQDTETSVQLQNTSRCEEKLEEIPQDPKQLDINFNPEIRLHRIDLPQQHVCKEEEVISNQQLWDQKNSSLDQEEPELPQMKDKREQLCSSQDGEQLVLKQETDTFMMTPTDQERDFSEAEANTEQLYAHNSPLTGRTNEEQSKNLNSGSTTDMEMNPKKKYHRNRTDDKSVDYSHVLHGQLDTESGEKVFKCDVCGKIFRKKPNMLCHYRVHTGERPFQCKTCGKAFTQKGNLLKHTRIHTGEKPFKCKTCGKAFARKSILQQHTRVHTGEKPFLCKTCGKTFTQHNSLSVHMRIHSGEKPYVCKICGNSFTQHSTLSIHMKIHSTEKPYECKTCGRAFTQKGYLLKHTRIHTGEKPYFCKICGKCFSYSSYLGAHMRIHTGEKPFKCKTCGKDFAWKSYWLKHSRIHTRGHIVVENIS